MSVRDGKSHKKTPRSRSGGLIASRMGRGVARYYQLYEHLSGALNDGTIPAGSALPSEPDLVTQYKVSRTTVRRALARLEGEGRIVRRRGSGTFARQIRQPERLHLDLHDYYAEVESIASQSSVSVLRFEMAPVPTSLRQAQPRIGVRALLIQRVRHHHNEPFMLTSAYLPEELGKKIRKSSLGKAPLLSVIGQAAGQAVKTEHTITAVAADAEAARQLEVPLGAPLIRIRAVHFDKNGKLLGIHQSLTRPDLLHVRAAFERPSGGTAHTRWKLKTKR